MAYPKLTPVVATGGTTPRYLGDRFADFPSVKDFGAAGDGVTDDTAAFQAAGAAHDFAVVPSGVYLLSDDVSGVFLMAKDAQISGDVFIYKAPLCRADLDESATIYVGSGQQFETLTGAMDFAFKSYNPSFNSQRARVNIVLKSGFVMAEQLVFDSVNCSFITISSEDATVSVACEDFTIKDTEGRYPLFMAENGGKSPLINVLFVVPEQEEYVGVYTKIEGFFAGHFGEITLAPGAGIKNAERGVTCVYGGRATCTLGKLTTEQEGTGQASAGIDLTGTRGRAVFCAHQGYANLPRTKASGSGDGNMAIYVIWNSFANLYQSDISNANGTAFYVRDASVACGRECNVSGASNSGYHALHTARIDARYHPNKWSGYDENDPTVPHGAQNCANHAVMATFASHIDCSNLPCDGAGGTAAILSGTGSTVSATEGVTITGGRRGLYVEAGGLLIGSTAVIKNTQYSAIQCGDSGGKIIATNCTIQNCGGGALAEYSGFIDVSGSEITSNASTGTMLNAKGGGKLVCNDVVVSGGERALEAGNGGSIYAYHATINNPSGRGVSAIDGGLVHAYGVTITSNSNIEQDINAQSGARVVATLSNLLAPTPNIRCTGGSLVQAVAVTVGSGETLSTNITKNTLTADGIIFG